MPPAFHPRQAYHSRRHDCNKNRVMRTTDATVPVLLLLPAIGPGGENEALTTIEAVEECLLA